MVEKRCQESEHRLDAVNRRYDEASRERAQASRERDEARKMVVRQIQLCQRLLRRPVSDSEDLAVRSLDELRDLADRLERDLTG